MLEDATARPAADRGQRFEILCGMAIAVLAAVLAITDLGAGKYGDDELIAHNEKGGAYLWYQSKGIKETLVEGQRDTLQALVAADSIRPEQIAAVEGLIQKLDGKVQRYGKEKKEILQGSTAVGEANWVQDVGGKMGQVTGAQEWEAKANALDGVGNFFDYSTFFLQLCLVFGAISLVVQRDGVQRTFFRMMIGLGLIGMMISVYSFYLAMQVA
jgi:hypothetical protein